MATVLLLTIQLSHDPVNYLSIVLLWLPITSFKTCILLEKGLLQSASRTCSALQSPPTAFPATQHKLWSHSMPFTESILPWLSFSVKLLLLRTQILTTLKMVFFYLQSVCCFSSLLPPHPPRFLCMVSTILLFYWSLSPNGM